MRHLISLMTIASLAAIPLSASALSAEQTVQKETTTIGADGSVQIVRETVEKIVPGERVVYSLNFTNDDAAPANDIVLTMPIPSEVKFIEGTADTPATTVTFSADGGESFASREKGRFFYAKNLASEFCQKGLQEINDEGFINLLSY